MRDVSKIGTERFQDLIEFSIVVLDNFCKVLISFIYEIYTHIHTIYGMYNIFISYIQEHITL